MLALEDFTPGRTFELRPYAVTKDEVLAFAREFDPQPMHLDEAAGAVSLLGGLAASGWHVAAIFMRMAVDSVFSRAAFIAGHTAEDIRWLRPVFPGDTLSGRAVVVEARPSSRDPMRGYVKLKADLTRQTGETVTRVVSTVVIGAKGRA